MEEVTTVPIAAFIEYYYTPEDERIPWDEFKTRHDLLNRHTYDECLEWLKREDGIKALQVYHRHMKNRDLSRLYDAMMQKALDGNTQAATWVENFMKSDYFDESESEIDSYLDGINIPALNNE